MLGLIKPKEQVGRDTFARYKAQVRSVAIAALKILEAEGNVDRVYCDLHDDYVVRYKFDSGYKYSFFQVKTKNKSNYSWNVNDLFGITSTKKNPPNIKKMQNSFGGKMLLHAVNFPDNCEEIIFQTNITLNDSAQKFISEIVSGNFTEKETNILYDKFHEIVGDTNKTLSATKIKICLSKFKVQSDVQYIKNEEHRFDSYAMEHIYKYSEIDLSRKEAEIILLKLVDLVSDKSSGIITEYNENTIESDAAISIDDLLNTLSISKSAYEYLKKSGDEKAIKSVSIIQRAFNNSGANTEQLMYCAECKVKWDIWWLDNRHNLPMNQLISIKNMVHDVLKTVVKMSVVDFNLMSHELENLKATLEQKKMLFDLNMDELIGAFLSILSQELG